MFHRTLVVIFAIAFGGVVATAQVTVVGKIMWQDRNGVPHPLRGAQIQIWDAAKGAAFGHGSVFTSEDGSYSVSIASSTAATSLLVKVLSQSEAASVHPDTILQPFEFDSGIHTSVAPGSTVTINLTGHADEKSDQAFSVFEAVTYGWLYADSLGIKMDPIDVRFPVDGIKQCNGKLSCFQPADPSLNILEFDRWDWDVVMHEYGHYVSKRLLLDHNPGLRHYIDANLEDIYPDKSTAILLAWGEGWPTFFSVSAQQSLGLSALNIPYVGDTHYTDTEDSTLDVDLASQNGLASKGEDNELSVSRILFYLVGGISTSHGAFKMSDRAMLAALTAKQASTLSESWEALTTGRTEDQIAAVGAIFADHLAAPTLLTPLDGGMIDGNPMSFTWRANGGGKSHLNSKFRLLVFDDNWKSILDSGELTTPSFVPTEDEWNKIRSASGLHWVVTGGNPDAPSTGPYSSFATALKH
jgi:hypothetical protein